MSNDDAATTAATNSSNDAPAPDSYEAMLKRARETDLSAMRALGFLYESGKDRHGNPVVVLDVTKLPTDETLDKELILLYIINVSRS